jgi:signal peptidase I
MSVFYFLLVSYLLLSVSLYFLFPKAGEAGWKGLIPGLNFVTWNKIIGQPAWKALWLLVPIVNIFVFVGMNVDMVRSFRKYSFWHSAIAVIYAPAIFFYLAFSKDEKYDGPTVPKEHAYKEQLHAAMKKGDKRTIQKLEATSPYKKGALREWTEAIVFAVFAAAFIRMFFFEMYMIPTSSMEGSLLTGDFLFVSKAHYGMRMPRTVLQVPLLHNRLPKNLGESYLKNPSLGYHRLPAFESIKHNEPVVFNYPEGDSVYITPQRTFGVYDIRHANEIVNAIQRIPSDQISVMTPSRQQALNNTYQNYLFVAQVGKTNSLVTRPIDKRDHYIKRCIGLPGDNIEIRDRQVFINGKAAETPTHVQFMYQVTSTSTSINPQTLYDMGVHIDDAGGGQNGYYNLTNAMVEKIKAMGSDIKVELANVSDSIANGYKLFPHDPAHFSSWSVDNYGPVYIPKEGATIKLTPENIALYRRVISTYEGNELEEKGGKFIINGKETTSYTFRQDYFWMMGDNRHNSEDSRFWGFVPEDHIVGKPILVWMSLKWGSLANGINWDRIFTWANKK